MDEGVSAEAAQVSEKVQVDDGSKDNNDGAGIVYPSGLTLVLLMMSCFIAMFLVALVRTEETVQCLYHASLIINRTNSSLLPRFPRSQMNSIRLTILGVLKSICFPARAEVLGDLSGKILWLKDWYPQERRPFSLPYVILSSQDFCVRLYWFAYSWYGTAYLLTNCAFLLVFGKLYIALNVKTTFLVALILFEVGSVICGAAPNSIAFIVGRAIAGLGAGGVQSGIVSAPRFIQLFYLSIADWQ